MSDTYQPIYDAVRSRIQSCNVSHIVAEIAREALDISMVREQIRQEFSITADEMRRPSVLYRAKIVETEGDQWMAHYGPICGYGETPAKAMLDFDASWIKARTTAAARGAG